MSTSLPPLPDDLTPLLLPLLLPPTVPLPPHLLSPLFRHRLLYLPPAAHEMDRQLSPFPMPITSDALQSRLESLAAGYDVGPVRYAHDGECGLARRCIEREGRGGEGVEMHFLHDTEEGWGFHGLRMPGQAEEMGLKWVDHPSDIFLGGIAPESDKTGEEETGSLDPYAYTSDQSTNDAEVRDYWAGFSPPHSPTLGPEGTTGAAIDEDEREREYWAQYSNGPSKAASPIASRQTSEMNLGGSGKKAAESRGRTLGRTEEADDADGEVGPNRARSGTIVPTPARASRPPSPPPVPPNSDNIPSQPTLPSRRSTPPVQGGDISLLRDRLRMKTLSLLQREWAAFLGEGEQDEMEEKGIRWLALGREVKEGKAAGGIGGEDEGLRKTMGMLRELHDVYEAPEGGSEGEGDGFYRLVEQALRSGEGLGEGGAGGEAQGIPRNYSFDQATYWE